MRLTVLGSSGTYPSPSNPASSFLVENPSGRVWMDAGPGSFGPLSARVDPGDLSGVLISHRHLDHCADVFAAVHALRYRPAPVTGVPLFAHQSVIGRLEGFLSDERGLGLGPTFEVNPIEAGDSFVIGSMRFLAVGMDHSVPTLGFRCEAEEAAFFYTADTGTRGTWKSDVGAVDLLICEASWQGEPPDSGYQQHLTAGQAGEIAADVEATRLLLTHIPPYLDALVSIREAERTFGKTAMVAVPGATHEV